MDVTNEARHRPDLDQSHKPTDIQHNGQHRLTQFISTRTIKIQTTIERSRLSRGCQQKVAFEKEKLLALSWRD
jgi:hypothetical protein